MNKTILTLKNNLNDKDLLTKTETNNQKNIIDKLKEDIKRLSKNLSQKEEEYNNLLDSLNKVNNTINQSENEIEKRNNTIDKLIEEKNQLIKQLNENQEDFDEYRNSSQQEIELLHQKVVSLEEERENLINDNENQITEVNQLKDELNQFASQDQLRMEENQQYDNRFNNLATAFQIKEKEFGEELYKMKNINQKLMKENENMKAKYEKKINLLTLQNNEATLRVKKLINTCIQLKDTVMTLQRKMGINMGSSGILGQINNSMFLPNTGLNINNMSYYQFNSGAFQKGELNNNDNILNNDDLDLTY